MTSSASSYILMCQSFEVGSLVFDDFDFANRDGSRYVLHIVVCNSNYSLSAHQWKRSYQFSIAVFKAPLHWIYSITLDFWNSVAFTGDHFNDYVNYYLVHSNGCMYVVITVLNIDEITRAAFFAFRTMLWLVHECCWSFHWWTLNAELQESPPAQKPSVQARSVVSLILGGGAGTRLFPLTHRRAKPAVSVYGHFLRDVCSIREYFQNFSIRCLAWPYLTEVSKLCFLPFEDGPEFITNWRREDN